jgi:hypothetical protein
VFDLFADIGVRDTGTAVSAERVRREVKRFTQDYFGDRQQGGVRRLSAGLSKLESTSDNGAWPSARFSSRYFATSATAALIWTASR